MVNRATPEDRAVLSEWAEGFDDRDGKFVIEFQTTFNSAFWELYVFAVLKELQLPVDFSFATPDFVINPNVIHLVVEAGSASNAAGGRPEWSGTVEELKAAERESIVEEATIRLANALISKHRKYLENYALLSHVQNAIFVLAIAPFEQPFFWAQNYQAMQRVLYGYDKPTRVFDAFTGEPLYEHHYIESIRKANGAAVPLGYFRTKEMAEISAVLFSNTATWGKVRALSLDPNPNVFFETLRVNQYGYEPTHETTARAHYQESLLDGLHVFHNPHSVRPLPYDVFDQPGVSQHVWDEEMKFPYAEQPHGTLIQRTTITLSPSA